MYRLYGNCVAGTITPLSPNSPVASRSGLAASLLRALGEEGGSLASKKLREQIERLEQEEELRDYEDDEEEDDMVSKHRQSQDTSGANPLPANGAHVVSWTFHKPIGIYMGDLMLGVMLQYVVSASFSCFLRLVKSSNQH